MGLFKKKAEPETATATAFDPFLGDAALRVAYDHLLAGNWATADRLRRERPDGWLMDALFTAADSTVEIKHFETWAHSVPGARTAALVGAAQVRDGEYRAAEQTLTAAMQKDPKAVEPWIPFIASGARLDVSKLELKRRFEEAHRRAPFHPAVSNTYVAGMGPDLCGSPDEMLAIARWIDQNAPAGAAARSALPVAHLTYAATDDSHLAQTEVHDEVLASATSYLTATAQDAPMTDLHALNCFVRALLPLTAASAVAVKECIRRIANRPTREPWIADGANIAERYATYTAQRLTEASAVLT